jgi:hypothetical protein
MPTNDTPSITISLGENLAANAKIQVAGGAPSNLNAGSGAFEAFETLTSVDEVSVRRRESISEINFYISSAHPF